MMFAKPAKKPNVPAGKAKAANKTKTVSVKNGLKGGPSVKKSKSDVRSLKPPQRPDPGYSLYSTDSEDQVTTAFTEMEACEKILTQLKSKQKGNAKPKKKKATSPKPKALNDGPPVSQVPTSIDYRLPYSTALYLRHLQTQDATNNPVYNSRLVSSTPDPDKLLADLSSSKLSSNLDQVSQDQREMQTVMGTMMNYSDMQDVPVRDVSSSSSVPPSQNHLRNMADMVDIYKRVELRKYQQLHEAALIAELEKLQSRQTATHPQQTDSTGMCNMSGQSQGNTGQPSSAGSQQGHLHAPVQCQIPSTGQGHIPGEGHGENLSEGEDKRLSEGFLATGGGSLGFNTATPGLTTFKPIPFDASQTSTLTSGLQGSMEAGTNNANMGATISRGSSSTGFHPYLETTAAMAMPPSGWIGDSEKQIQQRQALQAIKDLDNVYLGNSNQGPGDLRSTNQGQGFHGNPNQGQDQVEPLKLLSDIAESEREGQTSGRTDSTAVSQGTDYAGLPQPQGQGQPGVGVDMTGKDSVEFKKQNGLFQIQRVSEQQNVSDGDKCLNVENNAHASKSDSGSIQIIPEKDVPVHKSTRDDGCILTARTDASQTSSDSSTPRNQNSSGLSSHMSQSGKVVFIPNDNSGTQNVIGYIPGIPMVSGYNQPINLPVTYEVAADGSVLSSVTGPHQGQVTLQTTAQGVSQNLSGSGFPTNSQANSIAAGEIGVRKLRFLLKELKECNKVTKDVEINRLVTDIDSTVNDIPQLSLTFNLYTEIELALQPLRSENCQLRRKLRLLNHQLKNKEEGTPKDINFEKLHLQTSNEALQKIIKDEKEIKTRLAAEVQHVHGELHKMRVERSKMIAEVSEKETLNLKFRQETLLETQKMAHQVQLMKKDQEIVVKKLEALEKENHILQVTLQQRDAEIERQNDVVETMKASISDLLHELDQSRAAEQGWDQNTSFGLNKLMRIMEEEDPGFAKKPSSQRLRQKPERKIPERRKFDFNSTANTSGSSAKLTREALAHHDRKHSADGADRLGLIGRQGPASESDLDTLVELYKRGRDVLPKGAVAENPQTRPVRRRTTSSSPVRFRKSPQGGEKGMQFDTRLRNRSGESRNESGYELYDRERVKQTTNERHRDRNRHGMSRSLESSPASKVAPAPRYSDASTNYQAISRAPVDRFPSNRTDISDGQSRYSVTEYFRKYPSSSTKDGQSLSTIDPRSFVPQGQRSYPDWGQQVRNVDVTRAKQTQPDGRFETSSEYDDITMQPSVMPGYSNVKQRTLFKGLNYEDRISTIPDDDQLSSVSMSSVTTANTVDEVRFRSGIATLDANIAKLQMALQRTKSMLN